MKTKNRLRGRRSTPSLMRWMICVIPVVVGRLLWSSIVVINSTAVYYPTTADWQPFSQAASQTLESIVHVRGSQQKKRSRQKRPVLIYHDDSSPKNSMGEILSPPEQTLDVPWDLQSLDWRSICTRSQSPLSLSSSSRVLVSGVLTHTLASEVVHVLAKHCGVSTIVGLAGHAPDQENDQEMVSRLAMLLRKIPTFRFMRDVPRTQNGWNILLSSIQPTHIILMEPTSFLDEGSQARLSPAMFAMRDSIDSIERICGAISNYMRRGSVAATSPRLLYVTREMMVQQNLHHAVSRDTINPMILQAFRAQYGVDTFYLKLPDIYGPFASSPVTPQHLAGHPSNISKATGPCMHIDDAVETLITSLTLPGQGNYSFSVTNAPVSLLISAHDVAQQFANPSQSTALESTRIHDRSQFIISWDHQRTHPFEQTPQPLPEDPLSNITSTIPDFMTQTYRRLDADEPWGISQMQRRQHRLVPCDSECAGVTPCQNTSVFSSILQLTRTVSGGCRFVVSTSNFSPDLTELPPLREHVQADMSYPPDLLCKFAFVSGNSPLVASLLRNQSSTLQQDGDSGNGKLVHNGWTIVWVPNADESTMSEADYVLPKVAPGAFFGHNVTKNMYVAVDHIRHAPPMPVTWLWLNKKLDAKKRDSRYTYVYRRGTNIGKEELTPFIPARHIALFTHSLGRLQQTPSDEAMSRLSRLLLRRRKLNLNRPWPRRQQEFYTYVLPYYDWEIVESVLVIHNLQSDRSRQLRCEWLEEHAFWADEGDRGNRQLEDLSLSYVLAKMRIESRLVASDDYERDWGERMIDPRRGDTVQIGFNDTLQPNQYFVKLHDFTDRR